MEGDILLFLNARLHKDFYPRPPGGGRHEYSPDELEALNISIHALRVEGDSLQKKERLITDISIHALRVEGDGQVR